MLAFSLINLYTITQTVARQHTCLKLRNVYRGICCDSPNSTIPQYVVCGENTSCAIVKSTWISECGCDDENKQVLLECATSPPPSPPSPPSPLTLIYTKGCGTHHIGYYAGGVLETNQDSEWYLQGNFTEAGNISYAYVYGERGYFCAESLNSNCALSDDSYCGHIVYIDAWLYVNQTSHLPVKGSEQESAFSVEYTFEDQVHLSKVCVEFNTDKYPLRRSVSTSIRSRTGQVFLVREDSDPNTWCSASDYGIQDSVTIDYHGWYVVDSSLSESGKMFLDGRLSIRNVQFFSTDVQRIWEPVSKMDPTKVFTARNGKTNGDPYVI